MSANAWQPIETAPKDGTAIDLWIVGPQSEVSFYDPACRSRRGGRAVDFAWLAKPPNSPNWYPRGGLGYPLSPEVTPTHWMPLPEPPK